MCGLLSVWIDVSGCVFHISSSGWLAGMDSLLLMKSAPSSASAADEMTALIFLDIVNTAPLLGGNYMVLVGHSDTSYVSEKNTEADQGGILFM